MEAWTWEWEKFLPLVDDAETGPWNLERKRAVEDVMRSPGSSVVTLIGMRNMRRNKKQMCSLCLMGGGGRERPQWKKQAVLCCHELSGSP